MGNPRNSVVAEHALCNCRRDFRVETDNLTLSHVTVVYCLLLCNRCECGQRFILFY